MGIRDQRKMETSRKIQAVALDLVEEFGLEATTVARIAEKVGISERTFFRYFDSKEAAIVPGQGEIIDALTGVEIAEGATPAEIFQQLIGSCRKHILFEVDVDSSSRLARIMINEPKLLLVATRREQELVVELSDSLRERDLVTGMQGVLIAELIASMWRVTWQNYTHAKAAGSKLTPADYFEITVKEMTQISSGFAGGAQ
ncbi:TetR family transcriptional regulator [Glutamicibacter ectropisis]|uniref:TetR family transcriptional regulator n=1 Tax=Glutamicibacter ectropisis TaxID=3046593 RepID=A0AAU6WFL5_9MICC